MLAQADITSYAEEMKRRLEGPEDCPEHWLWLHRRLAAAQYGHRICLTDLCQAYEDATGVLTGCD
jgi:hypothetical protein